ATPSKPKVSVWKTRSSSNTTITPPTAAAGPRLTTSEKDKGTSSIPGVPNVPTDEPEEEISWNSTDEKGDDKDDDEGDDGEEGDGNDEGQDNDAQDDDDQEDERNDEDDQEEGNGEENMETNVGREEGHDKEEEEDELYRDVNINLGRGIQMTQEFKDSHVTLTLVNPDGQQQSSSVSSQFVTSMLNLTPDAGMKNSIAHKEYYAVATGATPPKPKASVQKTRSSSDTTITPLTAAAGPRLTTSEKGKQAVKSSKAKNEGTGFIPVVPDVPTDESEEEISWNSTDEEGDDDEGNDGGDDGEERDDDDDDEQDNDEAQDDDDQEDEGNDEDDEEEENLGTNVGREEGHDEEEEEDKLYKDININLGRGIQTTQEFEDSHVTLIPVNPDGQQQSPSVSSQFVTSMLNPTPDARMESIFETTSQMDVHTPTSVAPLPMSAPTLTPSTIATITTTLQGMNEAVKVAVQIQSDRLRDEAQAENDEFLKTIDKNMQKIIKEQVKEQVKVQVSKILPKIKHNINEQLEAKVLTRSSNSSKTSYDVPADLSEMEFKKILIEKMEGNKSIHRSNKQRNLYKALVKVYESNKIILDTYGDIVTLKRLRDDDADKDEEPSAGSDRGSKRRRKGKEPELASAPQEKATRSAGKLTQGYKSRQTSASESATAEEPIQTTFEMEEPSHPEFETGADDQPIVEPSQHPEWFSQQKKPPTPDLETLTPKLLAGPTYELMEGSYKSLVELKFFLEEVYKATTDQLDWVNPKGQQYPHNLLKPLPLIPNNRGRRVIPFDHFINNDLKYLRGGASSRKYTTSVTKTNAADYRHIKIIAITELKIIESHNYKHLDWITVRRDDDKLYKFKEGDFKRLRIQDIEDMLLLRVQGKLTNLTVEERFAFNVSLQMFTRSILIQRRVEDLQLGVESYQKKINLTKPDMYRSDLKCKEAYITYSNPKGFIYQNKDKQNRLMRIDELHKFSNGTLTDICTALDDRLKGIRMKYLRQSIWRKSDKDRAAALIQAIDKRLKTRRIMRILERYYVYGAQEELLVIMKNSQSVNLLIFISNTLIDIFNVLEGMRWNTKKTDHIFKFLKKKVVRHRYSNLVIQPEPEGSTQGYPLVSVEVLRYDKRSKSENMGIVPTKIELILEHTQQGISHEVL
nr:hypothetical protein [Tanacetum cinerariifolium]